MKLHKVCAWCLPGIQHVNNEPTTHGICRRCMALIWADLPLSTKPVLEQQQPARVAERVDSYASQ